MSQYVRLTARINVEGQVSQELVDDFLQCPDPGPRRRRCLLVPAGSPFLRALAHDGTSCSDASYEQHDFGISLQGLERYLHMKHFKKKMSTDIEEMSILF